MGNHFGRFLFFIFVSAIIAFLVSYTTRNSPILAQTNPPNIILILTDDQRWDTLCNVPGQHSAICDLPMEEHPMPVVEAQKYLGAQFVNAVVTNPVCCPTRASLLSGGYFSHHNNVLNNSEPNGGVSQFTDTQTLPTRLMDAGYKTAIIGKYLNEYGTLVDRVAGTGPVPPGWSKFVVSPKQTNWKNNFDFVIGSSTSTASGSGSLVSITDGTYLTDYEKDQALAFIDENCQFQQCDGPLFLLFAPQAPHAPATPPTRHKNLFPGYIYRDRGFGEQPDGDVSDKPVWLQTQSATWTDTQQDNLRRKQLQSLRAVDEAVGAIIDNLTAKDLMSNTYIIFVGDNGNVWGEHKISGKSNPYEESIRVPFLMRGPNIPAGISYSQLIAMDLELPATILDIAGLNTIANDGISLMPLMIDSSTPVRNEILLQHYFSPGPDEFEDKIIPNWAAIRTADDWKYVEYTTGEKELYTLSLDPYELLNKQADPLYADTMASLSAQLADLGRGVAIKTDNFPDPQKTDLPNATLQVPYSFQLSAWGGDGNYTWSHYKGSACSQNPPQGISITSTGLISGTPTKVQTRSFCVRVVDTSNSPQPGNDRPQGYIMRLKLTVNI